MRDGGTHGRGWDEEAGKKNMRGKETWRLHARVGILQGIKQDGAQRNSTEMHRDPPEQGRPELCN